MASFREKLGEFANTVSKRMYGFGAEDNADNFRFTEMFGGYKEKGDLNAFTGTVYDCVNLISEVISQYEPEIYKGDNEEEEKQHELLTLIQNPQPNIPAGIRGSDLLYGTEAFILLSGEAFWYLARGAQTGKPKDIILLNPAKIGIAVNKQGEITGYFTKKDGKPDIPLDIEEIIHLKTFNPKNPYRGLSVVKTHADEIATDDFSGQFTKNFFKNNAGISGVLSIQGMVNAEAFKKFAQQWRQKYEGVDNAGKTALLRESEATFTKVGLGLDQLDMTALKKMTKDDILQAFRVPLPLLGKAEGTGLNQGSVEALEYVFAKYNIEPKLDMLDGALQLMIDRYWPNQQLRVEHESTIPENKEFEQKQQMEFLNKVMTVNEVRAQNGLDPIDGGDSLYVETNLLPIGTEPAPVATPGTEGSKSIKLTRTTKTEVIETDVMVAGRMVSKASVKSFRSETERLLGGYTKKVYKALQPIFDDQQKQVLSKVGKSMKKAAQEEELFDEEESNKDMVKYIAPILVSLLLIQGKRATGLAGGNINDFEVTDEMKKAQENTILEMAKVFNSNSNITLNEVIAESRALGESKAELKARIETVFSEMKGYRAERIARSETARSGNVAAVDAYKQTGFVTGKQWHTNDPCPYCAEFEGKIIGLDETFAVEGQEIGDGKSTIEVYQDTEEPPLHLNCKCDILPFRDEISNSYEPIKEVKPEINKNIEALSDKLEASDKRTRESKELKRELEEWKEYAKTLEDLVDGQVEAS
jgi:HK97 family phage portal protein